MSSQETSGYLQKQGGLFGAWKQRYFTLNGDTLAWYPKPGQKEKGKVKLSTSCQIQPAPDSKKPNSFRILSNAKTYLIAADTPAQYQTWFSAIQKVVGDSGPSTAPTPSSSASNASSAKKKMSVESFELVSVLGRGTYGKVQLVRLKETGHLYAMKSMSKQQLADSDQIQQTITEKNVLIEIQHPFLVSAHFTFQDETKIFMVLDYVPGGELFGRLKEERVFSEERVRIYSAEILLGLGHLHKLGYIYRDLKPENILVDRNGHLKITDFGLAKKTEGGGQTGTFCGTPEYLAPEMLLQQPYDKAVDWWSFGILIYEMLVGIPPFYDENVNTMYRAIVQDPVRYPASVSANAKDIISKLLDRNPKSRLGSSKNDFEDIKLNVFYKGLNWKDVLDKKLNPGWVPKLKKEDDPSNFCQEFVEEPTGLTFEERTNLLDSANASFQGFTCVQDSNLDKL